MHKIRLIEIFLIFVLSLIITLPFINQAYHIDDWVYLTAALKYNEAGFEAFTKGTSMQMGMEFPNYYITHPLIWPWFLALVIEVFNSSAESLLHLTSLISLVIIGISSFIIGRRYFEKPILISLIFLVTPAIMVLSHLIMTDIPTAAFFLLALALHIEGVEKKSVVYLIFAGFAAAISAGISYQALFIIFLFFLYNFLKKEKTIYFFISASVPVTAFIIWSLFTWKEIGIPHPFISFQWAEVMDKRSLQNFVSKFIGNINSSGAALFFPLSLLAIYFFIKKYRNILFISFVFAVSAGFILAAHYSLLHKGLFIIYFTAGFFLFLRVIILFINSFLEKDQMNLFLSLWFLTFFAAVTLLMPLGVTRYLLPVFLPLIIICLKDFHTYFDKKFIAVFLILFITSFSWGIITSIADYKYAGIYRTFPKELKEKYPQKKIWFAGDSGFKWYMEKEGFNYLLTEDFTPATGDIIVIPEQPWPYDVSMNLKRAEFSDNIIYPSEYLIKTVNNESHAGFYAEYKMWLPFSVSDLPYEKFSIYEIMR